MCTSKKRLAFKTFNPYKPGVLFVGHRQTEIAQDGTPQDAASHLGLFCLLTRFSLKTEIKMKKITPEAPKYESGLIQMIRMGKSIHHKWVNTSACSTTETN